MVSPRKSFFRVTTFFKSLITPLKMRLSIKSFREMKAKEFGQITTALEKDSVDNRIFGGVIRLLKNVVMRKSRFE